jgi:hypothetical protein
VTAARDHGSDFGAFLLRHNDFKPGLDAIEAQIRSLEQQKRDRYDCFIHQLNDLYTGSGLSPVRPVPFDPRAENGSYQALSDAALEVLKRQVSDLISSLSDLQSRATFLREFRNRNVQSILESLERERTTLLNLLREVDSDTLLAYRKGTGKLPAWCGAYQNAVEVRSTTNRAQLALEQPDSTTGPLQDEVLLVLGEGIAHRGIPLAELFSTLRRQRAATAPDMFKALEDLYTQGNLDIFVRPRPR